MEMMQPKQANPGDQMMEKPEAAPFTVCIKCNPDGTFAVGLDADEAGETMGTEAPEAPEGAEDASMRPARDVKEALTIALQIIKAGGKQEKAMGDFKAGYNEMSDR